MAWRRDPATREIKRFVERMATTPAVDDVLMIDPPPWAIITGTAYLTPYITLVRFRSITRCHSSWVVS